jgi:hypothetical protein
MASGDCVVARARKWRVAIVPLWVREMESRRGLRCGAVWKRGARRLLAYPRGNAEFAHADFLDLHALRFPAIKRA